MSRDGQRIVGRNGALPFIYTAGSGMQTYPSFNGFQVTEFTRISANGTTIIGDGYTGGSTGQVGSAFYRRADGTYADLGSIGPIAGSIQTYFALAVNSDGSLIGGTQGDRRAWIWDAAHGMRDLRDVLVNDYHFDLTNWTLETVQGISADGRFIVGNGAYQNGNVTEYRAYVAVIPSPASGLLVVLGLVPLRWRRR